jgi:hypothetical protein
MEEITKLMQLIDSNSDTIKEGNYLEMCNTIKSLYHKIPKEEDPPVVDLRTPLYRQVPPAAVMEQRIIQEWRKNAKDITDFQLYIKDLEKWLKSFKYLKNITASVKTNSVIKKAREFNLILENNTVQELRAAGVDIPDEREFYRSYIVTANAETAVNRAEVTQDLLDNNMELETTRARQRWLVQTYNL